MRTMSLMLLLAIGSNVLAGPPTPKELGAVMPPSVVKHGEVLILPANGEAIVYDPETYYHIANVSTVHGKPALGLTGSGKRLKAAGTLPPIGKTAELWKKFVQPQLKAKPKARAAWFNRANRRTMLASWRY